MNRINLITYADGNYIQHACVLLLSLADVVNYERPYRVFVYYTNCSPKALLKFEQSLQSNLPPNITYELIELDRDLDSRLQPKDDHLSADIYSKLFIYDDLPQEMEKVLFLDADIVLRRDPAEIYDLDLKGAVLAAVHEPVFKLIPKKAQKIIGVTPDQYFNSGVMLVNLPLWRGMEVSAKALEFCLEKWEDTPYHDQDAFNHVVEGNWVKISPLWNPRIENIISTSSGKTETLTKEEVYRRNLSYLIHYSGPGKPWFYMSFHPQKKIYLDYLEKTEFRDYQFPDYSTANRIRKQVQLVRRAFYFLRNGAV